MEEKKIRRRSFAAGALTAVMILGLGGASLAASHTIPVEDGIAVTINGVPFTPKDVNGKEVPLFAYNGTTYAPVRAFSKAAGLDIQFNTKNQTAEIRTADQVLASDPNAAKYITAEKAKAIALADAGVPADKAIFLKANLDWEDGRMVYEVEFCADWMEYDYDLDALTGAVLEKDFDCDDFDWAPVAPEAAKFIGREKAEDIALADAGVPATQATHMTVKLDQEDGKPVYDVEFYVGTVKYEYELDALTGAVRGKEVSNKATPPQPTAPGKQIGETKAKAIALADAGVAADKAVFLKVKLEHDNGKFLYELKFLADNTEYEYELDALTGAVIEKKVEQKKAPQTPGSSSNSSGRISEAAAKSIAQNRLPGCTVVKCELDREDGRWIYELEMLKNGVEYNCEIDAATGSILDFEMDD